MNKRSYYNAKFKAKVAMEAVREDQTIAEIAGKYQVDASQVTRWKADLVSGADEVFSAKRGRKAKEDTKELNELYRKIGKLEIQNEFLRGKLHL